KRTHASHILQYQVYDYSGYGDAFDPLPEGLLPPGPYSHTAPFGTSMPIKEDYSLGRTPFYKRTERDVLNFESAFVTKSKRVLHPSTATYSPGGSGVFRDLEVDFYTFNDRQNDIWGDSSLLDPALFFETPLQGI